MSYDIYLKDSVDGKVLELDEKHQMKGGTYCVGGTKECHVNVTYNYSKHFCRVLGLDGIRSLYGKTGAECIPILKTAMSKLKDDTSDDYWESTEGNAKRSISQLLALAQLRPDGVFDGD
jgi:hypothetical protein